MKATALALAVSAALALPRVDAAAVGSGKCITAASTATTSASSPSPSSSSSAACIAQTCASSTQDCEADADCAATLSCMAGCPTDDLDSQIVCTVQCAVAYPPGTLYAAVATCEAGCSTASVPTDVCVPPTNSSLWLGSGFDASTLVGSWWVIAVARAKQCQQMKIEPSDGLIDSYTWYYQPGGVAGNTTTYVPCNATQLADDDSMPIPGRFNVTYDFHGNLGADNWFWLSGPSQNTDYALLWYCGSSGSYGTYVGGVVVAKDDPYATLPPDVAEEFAGYLATAGLASATTLSDYSVVTSENCMVN
ncbi:hypothetical protein HK405_015135 [Cladochytrium tenue]|nr:hypothetical protein HK405_015135 [Cladochytrium tenue]